MKVTIHIFFNYLSRVSIIKGVIYHYTIIINWIENLINSFISSKYINKEKNKQTKIKINHLLY